MSATIGTLFSGGEGVGIGARAAGLRHVWGIEYDDDIAQIARDNGFNVITADVKDVDPGGFERPTILHASPPCPNFSSAKQGAEESRQDVDLARHIARFLELRPAVFTLENVMLYRKSRSWEIVRAALCRLGYWFNVDLVNMADFGVPQTRRRMIVRAMLGQMIPYLPLPEPWCGWYDAIIDLIPALPSSSLARWQLKRLPADVIGTVLFSQGISRDHKGGEYPITTRQMDEPAFTITANSNMNGIRALLVGGQYNRPQGEDRSPQIATDDKPSFTVTASYKGDWRALIIDGANTGRNLTTRWDTEPIWTLDASRPSRHPKNAVMRSGRIVKLNVQALARLQTFPDDYRLPDSQTLAGRIIGNAVPPLLYKKIIGQLIERLLDIERQQCKGDL